MKNLINKIAVLTAVIVLAVSISMIAETRDDSKAGEKITKRALADLHRGIQSGNIGLRKSSIYFAGAYEVKGAVDVLIEQLDKEENEQIRVLIALSLYKIGGEKAQNALQQLVLSDESAKVRRMAGAIVHQVLEDEILRSSRVTELK